jgi:integrase/recombinase XerD
MKLEQVISMYVLFRESTGTGSPKIAAGLKAFCQIMGNEIDIGEVDVEKVGAFLTGTGPRTRSWHHRHNTLRGFYQYAISRGHVAYSPLPKLIPKRPPPFVPYIYTHSELRRLLDAIGSFRKHRKLEPDSFRAMLLLLYGAGLRVSEALSLTLGDVDLEDAVLTVRETKFHKTRLVPLGPELHQAMVQYATWRKERGHAQDSSAPFFVGRGGEKLLIGSVEKAFRCLRTHAGVSRAGSARNQPRLHDLRHCFAVHRLTSWYQEGADVQKLLPKLATYMGHVEISSTQLYLTMTPELLQEAAARFERYATKEESHD